MPIYLKLFHKIETERTLPNLFYETTVALTTKPRKDPRKKENYPPISLTNIDEKKKNQQDAYKPNPRAYHKDPLL